MLIYVDQIFKDPTNKKTKCYPAFKSMCFIHIKDLFARHLKDGDLTSYCKSINLYILATSITHLLCYMYIKHILGYIYETSAR